MKTRFVKKILLGPDKGKNLYWLKRVIKAFLVGKKTTELLKHFKFIIAREEERG